MAQYRDISVVDSHIIAANKDKRVRVGQRFVIILYNHWNDLEEGARHQLALDFRSDSSSVEDCTSECEAIVNRVFSDYTS